MATNVEELDQILRRHLEVARRTWPHIALDDATFRAHLERVLPRPRTQDALHRLHASDLFLACACVHGDSRALEAFDELLRGLPVRMPGAVAPPTDDVVQDVRQLVREKLLLATPTPKLAEYAGRSTLRAWLRAVTGRAAVDLARRRGIVGSAADLLDELPSPDRDPELAVLKERYRTQFQTALVGAGATLSARERNVLRQHHIDGLTMDELATLHGVHRVTVVRWVTGAREKLAAETRRRLLQEFGVGRAELESIMRFVSSRLDISVRLALETRA